MAAEAIGPGRGPVYGTSIHTELKARIKALDQSDLHTELSYLNGKRVKYGTSGSVRVDVVKGDKDRPNEIYDLKTGSAILSEKRIREFREHSPNKENVRIYEGRP